jgi:hypothetical protein
LMFKTEIETAYKEKIIVFKVRSLSCKPSH